VASISTSAARTARGKLGVGKLAKIRADMLFLLMVSCENRLLRLLVLTDEAMSRIRKRDRERDVSRRDAMRVLGVSSGGDLSFAGV